MTDGLEWAEGGADVTIHWLAEHLLSAEGQHLKPLGEGSSPARIAHAENERTKPAEPTRELLGAGRLSERNPSFARDRHPCALRRP